MALSAAFPSSKGSHVPGAVCHAVMALGWAGSVCPPSPGSPPQHKLRQVDPSPCPWAAEEELESYSKSGTAHGIILVCWLSCPLPTWF